MPRVKGKNNNVICQLVSLPCRFILFSYTDHFSLHPLRHLLPCYCITPVLPTVVVFLMGFDLTQTNKESYDLTSRGKFGLDIPCLKLLTTRVRYGR